MVLIPLRRRIPLIVVYGDAILIPVHSGGAESCLPAMGCEHRDNRLGSNICEIRGGFVSLISHPLLRVRIRGLSNLEFPLAVHLPGVFNKFIVRHHKANMVLSSGLPSWLLV